MEDLESLEQTLIQHLRTSGLRSAREVSLVDEVLELRRRRRQLVTALETTHRADQERCMERVRFAEQAKVVAEDELRNLQQRIQSDLQAVETARVENEQRRDREEDERIASLRDQWASRFDTLRSTYENEQRALRDKMDMLVRERSQQEKRLSESLTQSLRETLSMEFQTKLDNALAEHKVTLTAVTLREQDALRERDKIRTLFDALKQDYGKVTNTLIHAQRKLEEYGRKETVTEALVVTGQREVDQLRAEKIALLEKVRQQQAEFIRERDSQKSNEKALLAAIDEKMRRMLDNKQKEITILKEEIAAERAKYEQLAQMLQDIAKT